MLDRVWQRNLRLFERLIRSVLFDHAVVEDVLQEAFTRVLQSGRIFPSEREAFNYLRRTVINTTVDFYRRQIRRRESPQSWREPISRSDPLELLIHEEEETHYGTLLGEIKRALQALPDEQQEAIRLVFDRHERKIKEICRDSGIPYSTLRSRMLSGLDEIRKHLRQKGLLPQFEEAGSK